MVVAKIKDPRGWGRWSGVVIQGKDHNGESGKLAVVSVYLATESSNFNSMWQSQKRKMDEMGMVDSNPRLRALEDLREMRTKIIAKHGNCEFIITGDWNFNPTATTHAKTQKSTEALLSQYDLVNPQHAWITAKRPRTFQPKIRSTEGSS
jgi:hypothetical protein